jgi:hypothetical protein
MTTRENFKGKMHFWACAFTWMFSQFRGIRPRRGRVLRLVFDFVAAIKLYRRETDFDKYTTALNMTLEGRDFPEDLTPPDSNVYYLDYHRQRRRAENGK